mgnify:CR=1 FL=1
MRARQESILSRARITHRHRALLIGLGAVALLIVGAVAGVALLLSGAYSTAATKQHFRITYRILELGLRYSVASYADDIEAPHSDRGGDVNVGQACYRQYCQQCHGAPGIAREAVGRGQLPSPGQLSQSAREWSAAELFYVTQQGVRMSGMPAWQYRISEEGLWSTVAFLKRMPELSRTEYESMTSQGAAIECPRAADDRPYTVERAKTMMLQYACHNCHQIEGVVGPITYVGPDLRRWSQRGYIAGVLPNTRENLVKWLLDPQDVSPQSLMPNLELTEAHASDIARYLFEES